MCPFINEDDQEIWLLNYYGLWRQILAGLFMTWQTLFALTHPFVSKRRALRFNTLDQITHIYFQFRIEQSKRVYSLISKLKDQDPRLQGVPVASVCSSLSGDRLHEQTTRTLGANNSHNLIHAHLCPFFSINQNSSWDPFHLPRFFSSLSTVFLNATRWEPHRVADKKNLIITMTHFFLIQRRNIVCSVIITNKYSKANVFVRCVCKAAQRICLVNVNAAMARPEKRVRDQMDGRSNSWWDVLYHYDIVVSPFNHVHVPTNGSCSFHSDPDCVRLCASLRAHYVNKFVLMSLKSVFFFIELARAHRKRNTSNIGVITRYSKKNQYRFQ